MHQLNEWLYALGSTGLDLFWRPMLAWTLFALPVYLALRCWRKAPPLMQYYAHVALLLALPLCLLLVPLVSLTTTAPPLMENVLALPEPVTEPLDLPPLHEGSQEALVARTPAPSFDPVWGLPEWLGMMTALALGLAACLLLRLALLTHALRRYHQSLVPLQEGPAVDHTRRLAKRLGVPGPVEVCVAPEDTTPMTFGLRRPVIVLPAGLLEDEVALRLTLTHELIHIGRQDYAVSWAVRLVGSLFAVHPGVWLLQRRIEEFREISCDAEALGQEPVGVGVYARLLLRFSPLTDPAGPMPLRMVELDSILKRRLDAMKSYLSFDLETTARLRRLSLPFAAVVLLIPAFFAACNARTTHSETVIVSSDGSTERSEASSFEYRATEISPEDGPAKLVARPLPPPPPTQNVASEVVRRQLRDLVAYHEAMLAEQRAQMERLTKEMQRLKSEERKNAARVELLELRTESIQRQQVVAALRTLLQDAGSDLAREVSTLSPTLPPSEIVRLIDFERKVQVSKAAENAALAARENGKRAFSPRVLEDLKRLEAQMTYLRNEIEKAAAEVDRLKEAGSRGAAVELHMQRIQLLSDMYRQRLERFETLKMEAFTEAALSE